MEDNWDKLKGKQVRLIIDDVPYPRPKDGIIEDVDDTHVWLKITNKKGVDEIKPFSRVSIKRID